MGERPFVYIAALPRTGSTLLSEALNVVNFSHILLEPHLGKNVYSVKAGEVARLREIGIDLDRFVRWRLPFAFVIRRFRRFGLRQDYFIHAFKKILVPQILAMVRQVGVSEVSHIGWQNYLRHFPEMRVVMLGRDPRDMYISYLGRWKHGGIAWRGPFTPDLFAGYLIREFDNQLALRENSTCLTVRYEDLCTDPSKLETIRTFLDSPIPSTGAIGAFVSLLPGRRREFDQHGSRITNLSVGRWQSEPEPLQADAVKLFELVPDYAAFWGY